MDLIFINALSSLFTTNNISGTLHNSSCISGSYLFCKLFSFSLCKFSIFFSDISWEDIDSPNRLVRYEDYSWSLFSKNIPAISFKIPDFIFSFFKLSLLRELAWIMEEVDIVRTVFINFYMAMSVPFLLRRSQPHL